MNNGGYSCFAIERGLYGTSPAIHSKNTLVLRLSDDAKNNLSDETVGSGNYPTAKLNWSCELLRHDIPDIECVSIPVLYTKYGTTTYTAGTPNMVNAVVDGNTVYMTDPGCDLFRNAVNVLGKVFVGGHGVWSLYHCRMGELHCGSEAERTIPRLPTWWGRPEFENWPYEKKEMSP